MADNFGAIDEGVVGQIEKSIMRGSPLGYDDWIATAAEKLELESTIKPIGRPRKY